MSWQFTVIVVVALAAVVEVLKAMGVFAWVANRLSEEPGTATPDAAFLVEFSKLQNDVDKIKLLLNFKEFKR